MNSRSKSAATTDPVLIRRSQIAKLVQIGKRIGYSLLLLAIVVFIAARVDGPRSIYNSALMLSMGISSLFLAPAIVFGYAVGAAEREDRKIAAQKAAKGPKAPRID